MRYLAASRGDDGAFGRWRSGSSHRRRKRRTQLWGAEGRYAARHPEGQYEPGSRGKVLRNLLGIVSLRKMALLERHALERMTLRSLRSLALDRQLTAQDIRDVHHAWLGSLYSWAGQYRQVNLSKDGFLFCAANRIPALMQELETGLLARHTPCRLENPAALSRVVAEIHAELVLIHPFRDGNGRVARHVSNMMVWQAGLPPLDFHLIATEARQDYFAAIRAAHARDYLPIQKIFENLIGSV